MLGKSQTIIAPECGEEPAKQRSPKHRVVERGVRASGLGLHSLEPLGSSKGDHLFLTADIPFSFAHFHIPRGS